MLEALADLVEEVQLLRILVAFLYSVPRDIVPRDSNLLCARDPYPLLIYFIRMIALSSLSLPQSHLMHRRFKAHEKHGRGLLVVAGIGDMGR